MADDIRCEYGHGLGFRRIDASATSRRRTVGKVAVVLWRTLLLTSLCLSAMGAVVTTFSAHEPTATSNGPMSIAVGDFDSDGTNEVAVLNRGAAVITVFEVAPSGILQANPGFPTIPFPRQVETADVNGDGNADLIVISESGSAATHLGDGAGAFSAAITTQVGGFPSRFVMADVTADGVVDLIVTTRDRWRIEILEGLGDGRFELAVSIPVGRFPRALTVADLDRDGLDDLAVGHEFDAVINVLYGTGHLADGTPSFAAPAGFTIGGMNGVSLSATDLSGDAIPDLLASSANGTVTVLVGRAGRTFTASVFSVPTMSNAHCIGDFDRDLYPDLVAPASGDSIVALLSASQSTSDVAFRGSVHQSIGRQPSAVACADLNGDGIADIVTGNASDNTVSAVMTRSRVVAPAAIGAIDAYETGGSPQAVIVGDFNSDGRSDAITANSASGSISLLPGLEDGSLGPRTDILVGSSPIDLGAGDFNGDGRQDVVVADFGGPSLDVLLSGEAGLAWSRTLSVGFQPVRVRVADLNGDGHADLITANAFGTVSIFKGYGDATFDSGQIIALESGSYPIDLAIGDFDGNGTSDIAVIDMGRNRIEMLSADRTGTFVRAGVTSTPIEPRSGFSGDFDGDGILDIVTANRIGGSVTLFAGLGNGRFRLVSTIELSGAYRLAAGDLNRDGWLDVFVTHSGGHSVLLGRGGSFAKPMRLEGVHRSSVTVSDIDGNGWLDVLSTGGSSNAGEMFVQRAAVGVVAGGSDVFVRATSDPGSSRVATAYERVLSGGLVGSAASADPPDWASVVSGEPLAYDVTSTATVLGQALVCVDYSGYVQPEDVDLWWKGSSGWRNITTIDDRELQSVCGVAPSLGTFAVGTPVPDSDGTAGPGGGTVADSAGTGAAFQVNPGVLSSDIAVTIEVLPDPGASPPPGFLAFRTFFVDFTLDPNPSPLPAPGATITLPLEDPLAEATVLDLFKYDPDTSTFVDTGIDGTVDAGGATATFTRVTGFSTFVALVREQVTDTTAPVLSLPASLNVEATSTSGAVVVYVISATDDVDPNPTVSCFPASGSTFPLGTTTVTCTATDASGNTAAGNFHVTVKDTTVPTLGLPAVIVVVAATEAGTSVSFSVTASDAVDPSPALSCIPASGSLFAPGVTTVTCSAADGSGNSSQGSFTVQVTYGFIGFKPPIANDGSSIFRSNRVVPVKFQLTLADGSFVTNASATLQVFRFTDATLETKEEVTPDAAGESNTDNLFRFEAATNEYVYNLKTSGYVSGTYLLRAAVSDGTIHEVLVSVR